MNKRARGGESLSRRRFIVCGGTVAAGAWLVECGQMVQAADVLCKNGLKTCQADRKTDLS